MKEKIQINSHQREFWSGTFGDSYIDRNDSIDTNNKTYKNETGVTVEEIFNEFFEKIDRKSRILELGCNIGVNLEILKKMGFSDLHGLEINKKGVEIARSKNPDITFIHSSIEEYHNNKEFDLVFTAGVLIHINPKSLNQIIQKIISLTSKYVFGLEYYADKLVTINYRDNTNTCWKQNFSNLYLQTGKINILKERKIFYKDSNLIDTAYLLNKSST